MPTLEEIKAALAQGASREMDRNLPPPPPLEEVPPETEMVDVPEEPPAPDPRAGENPPLEIEDNSAQAGATPEERRNFARDLLYGGEEHQPPLLSGEVGGALAGGAAGLRLGAQIHPVLGAAGAVGGAIVGAMGGAGLDEGAKQVWQQATGKDETPEDTRGWLEVLAQAGNRGMWDALTGEILGFATKPVRNLLRGPTAKHFSEQLWLAWEQGGEGLANQYRWIKRAFLEKGQPYIKSALGAIRKMDEKQEQRLALVRKRQERLRSNQEFGLPSAMSDLYKGEGKGGFFATLGESATGAAVTGSSLVYQFAQRRIRAAEAAWYKVHDDLWQDYSKRVGIPFRSTKEALDDAGRFAFAVGKEYEAKWRGMADELFQRGRQAFEEDATSVAPDLYQEARNTIGLAMSRRGKPSGGFMDINDVSDRVTFRAKPRAGADTRETAEAAEWLTQVGLFQEAPAEIPLQTLWDLYKELGRRAGAAKTAGGGGESSVWTNLFIAASKEMDRLAENAPGPAKELFRESNKFYRINVARRYLENETWQAMEALSKNQSKIGEMLINKDTTPEDIGRMRSAFGKKGFDRIRAGWAYSLVRRLARDATKPSVATPNEGEGLFSIYKILRETSEDAIKPRVFRALMGSRYPQVQKLRMKMQEMVETRLFKQGENLARNMDAMMTNQRLGILAMGFMKGIAQAGGGAGLAGGGASLFGGDPMTAGVVGASAALLAPIALGRILFTEAGLKWLIEGADIELRMSKAPLLKHIPGVNKIKLLDRDHARWIGRLGHVLATTRAPWEEEQEGAGSRGEEIRLEPLPQ